MPIRTGICQRCARVFIFNPQLSRKQRENTKYCSYACANVAQELITHTCKRCNKVFTTQYQPDAIYCSKECTRDQIIKQCTNCNKDFTIKRSHAHKRFTCSRECASVARYQKYPMTLNTRIKISTTQKQRYDRNNPSWRGVLWKRNSNLARLRDNYTCKVCRITQAQYGRTLAVHHIIPFRCFEHSQDANELNNLITLCQSCHMKAERGKQITVVQLHALLTDHV